MAIIKRGPKAKHQIDLSGPQGNAYFLLGTASRFCGQVGKDFDELEKEMTSGDYENLIQVFDRNFGQFVDLVR